MKGKQRIRTKQRRNEEKEERKIGRKQRKGRIKTRQKRN